jgi:hypothetical protein
MHMVEVAVESTIRTLEKRGWKGPDPRNKVSGNIGSDLKSDPSTP